MHGLEHNKESALVMLCSCWRARPGSLMFLYRSFESIVLLGFHDRERYGTPKDLGSNRPQVQEHDCCCSVYRRDGSSIGSFLLRTTAVPYCKGALSALVYTVPCVREFTHSRSWSFVPPMQRGRLDYSIGTPRATWLQRGSFTPAV